jgi:hypothetical protein
LSDRPQHPLAAQVLAGASPELQVLAAEGLLPLGPEDLVPLQVELTRSTNPMVAQRSRESLGTMDPKIMASFLASDAPESVLAYFAEQGQNPAVLEAIIRRRDVPRFLLVEMARQVGVDLQEILLLRQDAIVEEPGILDALEENPQVGPYALRRIAEFREHLLRQTEPAPAPSAPPTELAEPSDEDLQAAIEAARGAPPSGEEDEVTGLTEGQIRTLPVGARLRLSRGAPRGLRGLLIRDSHPLVAVSTLENNVWSDQEVEQLARSRSISEDVLKGITKRRDWMRKYPIVLSLVANPRTPIPAALRLLTQLGARDLRNLSRDRNVSDAVRSQAGRLYRIKAV